MSDGSTYHPSRSIAIVGMSGRFPGARNIEQFWRNLCAGVESITFFQNDELEPSLTSPVDPDTPNFIKAGPILDDVESFDASFFGYTPRDAEIIDPQHRLFLECAWEALEHAGYDSEQYKGWIGVYGGLGLPSYLLNNLYQNDQIRLLMASGGTLQLSTANNVDYLSTRVAYKLNLKGPSITLQTACSTALVAVHLACQNLLSYQCDMALAGGVSVRVPQYDGYWYQEGGIMSPDGHCRAFDERAQGTVFGSGVGIVVLKRLDEAIKDGDTIHAIIRGSAVNNDGALKVGFTAPGVDGQMAVIAMAQRSAGVDPATISYVEAHGTATPVGDPIEVSALTQVFRSRTEKKHYCALGSVKTNIGHANTAAGIAGLIKTVLALKHGVIPPSLHFERPNPKIDFENSPFFVNTELREWQSDGDTPRRAALNSFGVGGTNAHAVLEEAPLVEPSGPSRPWHLLTLSARSETALEAATDNLIAHLRQQPDVPLADVAYTLQVGRRAFNYRRTLVCRDRDDAIGALESRDPRRLVSAFREQRDRPIAFMFSGQGAQYVGMARDLYEAEPVFREQVDRCAALLKPRLGLDLRDVLYPSPERTALAEQRLGQTAVTQPALFVVEYALAQLWMSWGFQPQALLGHSIGEYVAATLAGVFSLEDALTLVAARARLMQQMPGGAMLTVPLTEQEVEPLLGSNLSLAAINTPNRCVVSGLGDAIDALERQLTEQGLSCRRLHTSHAFHSKMMEPLIEPFVKQVQRIRMHAPSIPYISNVTGTWITAEQATDPSYWATHLRQAVRFADGVGELLREPDRILLEVGPGQALSTLARQHPGRHATHAVLSSTRHPQEEHSDVAYALQTVGQLWLAGARVEWSRLYASERRLRVPLPTYPFERQRYWISPSPAPDDAKQRAASFAKKPDIADWFYIPSWKRSVPPVLEPGALAEQASWLLFLDETGVGAQLAQRLERAGQTVTTVTAGTRFEQRDDRAYALNPVQAEDYQQLLAALDAAGAAPQTIVHLWSVTPPGAAVPEQVRDRSFYSLFFLAQALGARDTSAPISIKIVSNELHKVTGQETLCPEKATLLGPCKVIGQEYPNLRCQSIDALMPPPGTIQEAEWIDQLLAECATPTTETVIAYRDDERWVQTFEAVRLGEAIPGKNRLREQGVYLITGGLGGIGLVLAEYLAQTAQARLVLTGRSAFPDRDEWQPWLDSHGEQDGTSQKIRQLQAIEALGGEVLAVRADVASADDMRAAVAQAVDRFGALHGVIHSAGIAGGGLIQLKTPEMAARVLAPKVTALRVLESVLADVNLDLLVLCSSTTGVIGGIGQVDYCAANAFLDAFAAYYAARYGSYSVSINWDAWQEVGMAVNVAASYGLTTAQRSFQKELAHPLLDRRIEKPSQETYLTEFNGPSHWVLSEHKIMGVPAIPGTGYLEMARAAFEQRAQGRPIELRDVFFMSPLMVAEDEHKEVHTILEGTGDSAEFRVISRAASKDGGEPTWQEHARGNVGVATDAPGSYQVDAWIERCGGQAIEVSEEEVRKAERFVYWGPRWMSLKRAYASEREGLAVLEMPPAFADDVAEYGLHPALLDVATAFGNGLAGQGESYLPLSYGSLTAYGALPGSVYSYVRYKPDADDSRETISFDITIVDQQGAARVEIRDFTMRRVSQSATRLRETAESKRAGESVPAAAATNGSQSASVVTGILSKEGVEVFKRIMSRSRLPQIVVSTRDLHMAIERASSIGESRIVEAIDQVSQSRPAHPRPNVQTPFVAPRSETEQWLSTVWQAVLGIEQVGIYDNFFELGGDSVLALQVIAKSKDLGAQLTPAQLFQHQTIAELAAAINPGDLPVVGHELAAGPLPLTPIQRWLMERQIAAPQHASQAMLLEVPPDLDGALLAQAVRHLIDHHAALRTRIELTSDGWQQRVAEREEHPVFSAIDVSNISPEAARAQMQAEAAALQASLDLQHGPLLRVALFYAGTAQPAHLLLAIHQLVVDAGSWPLVLADLWTAYRQLSQGAEVALPSGTAPFSRWAAQIAELARSQDVLDERRYWQTLDAEVVPLPRDLAAPDSANTQSTAAAVRVALDADTTRALLDDVTDAYRAQVSDLLLTALVNTLARWSGDTGLLLDLHADGRDALSGSVDLSRTVGCFTTRYPLRLPYDPADELSAALKTVKEALRRVPDQGLGYGLLRYLNADTADWMRALPSPEVSFSYLGSLDARLPSDAPWKLDGGDVGPLHSPGDRRPYLLAIEARIVGGCLELEWSYSSALHQHATIERLARACVEALQTIVDECQSPSAEAFTPSDFPLSGLDQETLNRFLSNVRSRS
ncbi:MAG TPA: SDR family NAD(P)-dependent oxidoreductase [Herpetosiphonaceae bacterium]